MSEVVCVREGAREEGGRWVGGGRRVREVQGSAAVTRYNQCLIYLYLSPYFSLSVSWNEVK